MNVCVCCLAFGLNCWFRMMELVTRPNPVSRRPIDCLAGKIWTLKPFGFPCVWGSRNDASHTHAATAADGSVVAVVVVIKLNKFPFTNTSIFYLSSFAVWTCAVSNLWCEYDFFLLLRNAFPVICCVFFTHLLCASLSHMRRLHAIWLEMKLVWDFQTVAPPHLRWRASMAIPKKMCCQCSGNGLDGISSSAFTPWFYRLRFLCVFSLFLHFSPPSL